MLRPKSKHINPCLVLVQPNVTGSRYFKYTSKNCEKIPSMHRVKVGIPETRIHFLSHVL